MMHNSQKRRLITGDMWRKISKAFPEAVAHRYEHPRDDATGNCEQCLLEKEKDKLFPQKIVEWKDNILQSETLNELLERGSTSPNSYPSAVDIALLHNSEEPMSCRVLHGVDVQRWRNCVDVASKFTKKKAKASRQRLNELMFISSNSSSLGREFRFRPLTCEHSRAVVDIPREEEVPSWLQKLNESGLELLFDQEYEELVQSISTLESILYYDGSANFPSAPTICLRVEESKSSTNVTPRICHRGCKFSLFNDEILEEGKIVPKPKQVKRPAKKDPGEEAPKGPLCKIHIHQIDSGSDDLLATSLIKIDIRFPTHELEMALDGNLAYFRLLLKQNKGKKLFNQRLFLICSDSSVEAQELLPDKSNLKTMQELAASGSSNVEASTNSDCELHMALTYRTSNLPNSSDRRLRLEEREGEVGLIAIACGGWKTADGSNDVVVGGKKTKRLRQERGFRGTFLQSTELTPPSQVDAKNDDGTSPLTNNTSPSTTKTATNINNNTINYNEDEGKKLAMNVTDHNSSDIDFTDDINLGFISWSDHTEKPKKKRLIATAALKEAFLTALAPQSSASQPSNSSKCWSNLVKINDEEETMSETRDSTSLGEKRKQSDHGNIIDVDVMDVAVPKSTESTSCFTQKKEARYPLRKRRKPDIVTTIDSSSDEGDDSSASEVSTFVLLLN